MCLRNGDWGFHRCGLWQVEGLEGAVVVVVVVVWLRGFLLSVGQVAGEAAAGCSLSLRVRLEHLELPCYGRRRSQASVGLEEF